VDRGKSDIRLESAICKMLATEWAWRIANDTMQIRGGRGYETAASLRERGESPDPVERFVRDCRINTIFEGSSEIMRLFIAREALDPHLEVGGPVLDSRRSRRERLAAALRAARFYAAWYPATFVPRLAHGPELPRPLAAHARWCEAASRRLARGLFHRMLRHGPALEKRQLLLGRFVEIGAELFAMLATLGRARALLAHDAVEGARAVELADYFCHAARLRIEERFRAVSRNADASGYALAQSLQERLPAALAEEIR
jgi:hypothetical protein